MICNRYGSEPHCYGTKGVSVSKFKNGYVMSIVPSARGPFSDPSDIPPSPIYVFRGHASEVTAIQFIKNNTRFASG